MYDPLRMPCKPRPQHPTSQAKPQCHKTQVTCSFLMRNVLQTLIKDASKKQPALLQHLRDKSEAVVGQMLKEPASADSDSHASVISAELMHGLQTLQHVHLPASAALLPHKTLRHLPDRCVRAISAAAHHAVPHSLHMN